MARLSGGPLVTALRRFFEVYAQVLFSRSPWVGALLVAATMTTPRAGASGILAIVCASLTAGAMALPRDGAVASACRLNPLLVGLALGATTRSAPWLVPAAAVATVFLTAALQSLLGRIVDLPPLSLPFLGVFWLALAAGSPAPTALPALPTMFALPRLLVDLCTGLGALFAVPSLVGGALVIAALMVHSRIATVLALCSVAVVRTLASAVPLPTELIPPLVYNGILTAIALGAVWFVPSRASFALAVVGVLISTLVAVGANGLLAAGALPISVLPFNSAVMLVLLAMRQRVRDGRPKVVERAGATPEETLAIDRQQRGRLRALYGVPLAPPFRGRWICTQGNDGSHTHRDAWRHAYDFEVVDAEDRSHAGQGARLADYYCYNLPVLAPASGTVVRVVDGVPDNSIGETNVVENWGNLVVICHAPGLYSLVAHLSPGSLRVGSGQVVASGQPLGACGSSGRSPFPHLHFQLQATPELGAPTIPCELDDVVVTDSDGERAVCSFSPREREIVRPLTADDDANAVLAALLTPRAFRRSNGAIEHIIDELDLYGHRQLRSLDQAATLTYRCSDVAFTMVQVSGGQRSVLQLIATALPRLPLERARKLRFDDVVSARQFRSVVAAILFDAISPLVSLDWIEMEYRLEWQSQGVIVVGASRARRRDGQPRLVTRAELDRRAGLRRVEVDASGRRWAATSVVASHDGQACAQDRAVVDPVRIEMEGV